MLSAMAVREEHARALRTNALGGLRQSAGSGGSSRRGANRPGSPRERVSIPALMEYGLLNSDEPSNVFGLAVASTRCAVQFTRIRPAGQHWISRELRESRKPNDLRLKDA